MARDLWRVFKLLRPFEKEVKNGREEERRHAGTTPSKERASKRKENAGTRFLGGRDKVPGPGPFVNTHVEGKRTYVRARNSLNCLSVCLSVCTFVDTLKHTRSRGSLKLD